MASEDSKDDHRKMRRLLEALDSPKGALVSTFIIFIILSVDSYLYFTHYLPSPSPAPTDGGLARLTATSSDSPRHPVLVSAGDIADSTMEASETATLVSRRPDATVLTLGDSVYERGARGEFNKYYAPTWGKFKNRTKPAVGNHEYETPNAAGYFAYFGKAAGKPTEGYYSFERGDWHLIALNSNCAEVGGCGVSSPQGQWLKADLAKNQSKCTLAYFHHPLFTSGEDRPGVSEVKPLWETLYKSGAEVVLNGHDHNYQRFAPQDPEGRVNSQRGLREIVVGTGGRLHYPIGNPIANTQAYNDHTFGVLKLTLHPISYEWKFIPVAGERFTDSGSARCH